MPALQAWKTVKRRKKKGIVEGALTGVLRCLSSIKLAYCKQKFLEKAVPLKLTVMLMSNLSTAERSKGQHANLTAVIQMAVIAV